MGLKSLFQNAAVAIVNAFDDIPVSIVYHSTGTSSYDTDTGVNTETGDTDYVIEKVFIFDYESREIDGEKIKKTDQMLLIPYSSMPVAPEMDDYVKFSVDGAKWNIVVEPEQDPTGAWYIYQIRRP